MAWSSACNTKHLEVLKVLLDDNEIVRFCTWFNTIVINY